MPQDESVGIVDLNFFSSGHSSNEGITINHSQGIESLTSPAYITIPLTSDIDMETMQCSSLSGNMWNHYNGCEVVSYNDTHAVLATHHFSYFTLNPRQVNRVAAQPVEMETSEKEECGGSLFPLFAIGVLAVLCSGLATWGFWKDARHKEIEYKTIPSTARSTTTIQQPKYQQFFKGHLFFGFFSYYRKEFPRPYRILLLMLSFVFEMLIAGGIYYVVLNDREDDNSLVDAVFAWDNDDFLIVVCAIGITIPVILIVSSLLKTQRWIGMLCWFILFLVSVTFIAGLTFGMCRLTCYRWFCTSILMVLGDLLIVQSLVAVIRTFLRTTALGV